MWDIAIQVAMGAVQGVTEWLPISSSGHLTLVEWVFGVETQLPYEVFLHVASLLVLLAYFRTDLRRLGTSLLHTGMTESRRELIHIAVATVATVLIALLLEPYESYFRAPVWLAVFFLANAVLLLLMRRAGGNAVRSMRHAILIGCVQGLAVIPALSRSAITIAVALRMGMSRSDAFRFSFLVSIPALAAAAVRVVPSIEWQPIYLVGFAVTLVTGYASLWLLQLMVERDKVYYLWIYNGLLAIGTIVYAVFYAA